MSQVTKYENLNLDAFDLYVEAVSQFGEYQVFLLDSLHGPVRTRYEMSLLGALPLVEIQVKSGTVHIDAQEDIGTHLYNCLKIAQFDVSNLIHCVKTPSCDDADFVITISSPSISFTAEHSPILVLDTIRKIMEAFLSNSDKAPFSCGFLGYFSYDAIHYLEKLPQTVEDDRQLPDIRFQFHSAVVHLLDGSATLYNHIDSFHEIIPESVRFKFKNRIDELGNLLQSKTTKGAYNRFQKTLEPLGINTAEIYLEEDVEQVVFQERVEKAKEYILNGDIFQVVISKRVRVAKQIHPYRAYARLRRMNPSPYMFMAEYPDMRLFGASPEVQFRSVDGRAQMKPIAGTSKGRGKSEEEDTYFRERLINNKKDTAEHIMLVDLCRNDLGRVCTPGTVKVEELMTVESYAHLFHLVSTVDGELKKDTNIFHALLATFPAGTLSGAPKIRAMEIIDELEDVARGPYGGFIGMVDVYGNANTAIIIRSVVEMGNMYYVQAGAGIVADSDARDEWEECGRKARAVVQVLVESD